MANKEIQRYKDKELLKWCKDLIFLRSDYPCKHLVISMTKLNFEEFQHQKLTTWKTIFFLTPTTSCKGQHRYFHAIDCNDRDNQNGSQGQSSPSACTDGKRL